MMILTRKIIAALLAWFERINRKSDRFWQVLDRKSHSSRFSSGQGGYGARGGKGAEEFQMVGKQHIPHDDEKWFEKFLGSYGDRL